MCKAFSAEEDFVAIRANPAELANLCRGVELDQSGATQVSKATKAMFGEITKEMRGFLPASFRATFKSGRCVEGKVLEMVRSGQVLQLNACKLVQLVKAWFSGKIYNPRRDRKRAHAEGTSPELSVKRLRKS